MKILTEGNEEKGRAWRLAAPTCRRMAVRMGGESIAE